MNKINNPYFHADSALETILYVSARMKLPTMTGVLSIIYLADRMSLEKYARSLFGGEYRAMAFGPAAVGAYGIITDACDGVAYDDALRVSPCRCDVAPRRRANLDWLSQSDIAVLDEALARHGGKDAEELGLICQDEVWRQARQEYPDGLMPMASIVLSLKDGEEILSYLEERTI